MKLPTVEVRYENLCVEAECKVVHGKPLPTLWNALKGMILVSILIHMTPDLLNSKLSAYVESKSHVRERRDHAHAYI